MLFSNLYVVCPTDNRVVESNYKEKKYRTNKCRSEANDSSFIDMQFEYL